MRRFPTRSRTFAPRWASLVLALGLGALARAAPADAPADAPGAAAAAGGRPLAASDFYRLELLSDPRVSPAGDWVAYVVTTNDRAADEQHSAIWMVSWDGRERLALTAASNGIRAPRWSPDGRYLAYVAAPAGEQKEQLMLLDRRGGQARALAALSDDIGDFAWSPDGKRLVLVLQPSADKGGAPQPVVIDDVHFKDEEGYVAAGLRRHLWLLDAADGTLAALTDDARFNEDYPVWSPDGSRVAFVRTHERGTDLDGRCDIDVIEARPGAAPTTRVRAFVPNNPSLAWSPDGRWIGYLLGRPLKSSAYMQDRLALVAAAGGAAAPRVLTETLDRAVMSYAFAADSGSLVAAVEEDRGINPARIEVATGSLKKLASGPFVIAAISSGGAEHTAVLYSDDRTPAEVYALANGTLRKLTAHNDAWLRSVSLGAVEELQFNSKDGTEIHGLIVKPPGYVPGKQYPTIFYIHGGSNLQDMHSLAFDDYQFKRQLLAANGFVVAGINYRGSSGRGSAFAAAILADWGHKDVEDMLAGADRLVALGFADPARLGIGGWSYGGLLTDYTIASDRRFKAAVSGAGSANQVSLYGSDEYLLVDNAEIGPPWRQAALWIKLSYPFFHADRIHTPTLFMGTEKDFNVPIAGGEQLYAALRTLGVATELIVYPGEYHTLTRPSFLEDRQQRMSAWFARYLR